MLEEIVTMQAELNRIAREKSTVTARISTMGDRGHTDRPHPQKSDFIHVFNSSCSVSGQCCVYLISCYT